MNPPFEITHTILKWHSQIAHLCGKIEGWHRPAPKPELRRASRIRAIHGSLAIEGNTLSLEQITSVLEGKRIAGPKKDILEAQNAFSAYEAIESLDIYSAKRFLKTHRMLMQRLIENPGEWRRGNVGIQKGKKVAHVAPPPALVPKLMEQLFKYIGSEKNISLAVLSCVFHYETSFIHPFMDGNGRIARLWQTAMLRKFHPIFAHVPIESMVKQKQREYYKALELSDNKGHATPFVEFMLVSIYDALVEFMEDVEVPAQTGDHRLVTAQERFGLQEFSRKDYRLVFKTISTATASRDLRNGVVSGLLVKRGEGNKTSYQFKKSA